VKLALRITREAPTARDSPTSCDECRSREFLLPKPTQKTLPLAIAPQPIQPQLNGGRFSQRQAHLSPHLPILGSGHHGAEPSQPLLTAQPLPRAFH
jgi:hypothetical protein